MDPTATSLPTALTARPELAADDLIVSLYGIASIWARTNEVRASSVVRFLMTLMRAAERYVTKDHDGAHKANAVMTVIRLIVSDETIIKFSSPAEREDVLHIIEEVGEPIITGLVEAAHDPMGTLGKISKGFQTLSGCCFPPSQKKPK